MGSVHVDTDAPEVRLGQVNLGHQLLVGLGHVVERHDVPAEAEEQVRTEGDEGPEGKLFFLGFSRQ